MGLAVAGCGTNDRPETKPTSGGSTAESSPTPTRPTVPADWKAASAKVAQLHVPPAWGIDSYADQAQTMIAPENKVGLSPGSGEIMADAYGADGDLEKATEGLAKLVNHQLKKDSSLTKLERLPDETINGTLFYHFRAETEYAWQDHYGTVAPTREQVTVTWRFNKSDIDRKGADALIAPIMATYEVL
ncbi:hypothetical protein FB381_0077 [Nocardioides albertanoniae]|uniref:Lipoprotein LpqN n=1 Tax=Nocardioides albertanoniae TaxID=1175486 RepID=A0A543A0V7_9ACTN|nr:hypothetical protein [Nocardioides albertanoniae]TQL66228.1 hypothetical protein FB381_0077 [Nocardioides albertanoniae]